MARNIPCSFISFLHNKDIFCYFSSFLVDSGRFHLTSTASTAFLIVELVVIKHGRHMFHARTGSLEGEGFLDVGSPAECLLHGIMLLAVPEIANDICLALGCHLH